jgi:hypothetical protein
VLLVAQVVLLVAQVVLLVAQVVLLVAQVVLHSRASARISDTRTPSIA